ncbi:hypothetical protein C8R43DRAFT_942910 [Mycena crocata]|nr:hypothetical protein C8R43DRAFT_942910 [Mycena crocata]
MEMDADSRHLLQSSCKGTPSGLPDPFLELIGCFQQNATTSAMINDSEGVRMFITRAWTLVVRETDATFLESRLQIIRRFLTRLHYDNFMTPEHLVEFVPAYSRITDHNRPVSCPRLPVPDVAIALVTSADDLHLKFLSKALECAFLVIGSALLDAPDKSWMMQALQSGVLRAIVVGWMADNSTMTIRPILEEALSATCMVYRAIVSQVVLCLEEVTELQTTDAFRRSDVFPLWEAFVNFAQTRITLLADFNENRTGSRRACDNLEMYIANLRETVEAESTLDRWFELLNIGKEGVADKCYRGSTSSRRTCIWKASGELGYPSEAVGHLAGRAGSDHRVFVLQNIMVAGVEREVAWGCHTWNLARQSSSGTEYD